MKFEVSICIPVFNMVDTIERACISALGQKYSNFEVLVVDNCSTDGTYEKVSSIKDERLRVVRNSENIGAYGNHNECLRLAKGEWVKFLHGDDDLMLNCIKKMMLYQKNNCANIGLIWCPANKLSSSDRILSTTPAPEQTILLNSAIPEKFVLEGNFVGTPSMVMLNRVYALRLGGFDLTLNPYSDGDLWMKMLINYSSLYLSDPLVNIRDDEASTLKEEMNQIGFLLAIEKQIRKWGDITTENYIKDKSIYNRWFYLEMFRYVKSSLYYTTKLQFKISYNLFCVLWRNKIFLQSILFFSLNFWKRDIRKHYWFETLDSSNVEEFVPKKNACKYNI